MSRETEQGPAQYRVVLRETETVISEVTYDVYAASEEEAEERAHQGVCEGAPHREVIDTFTQEIETESVAKARPHELLAEPSA